MILELKMAEKAVKNQKIEALNLVKVPSFGVYLARNDENKNPALIN